MLYHWKNIVSIVIWANGHITKPVFDKWSVKWPYGLVETRFRPSERLIRWFFSQLHFPLGNNLFRKSVRSNDFLVKWTFGQMTPCRKSVRSNDFRSNDLMAFSKKALGQAGVRKRYFFIVLFRFLKFDIFLVPFRLVSLTIPFRF
jgi:hypothetical protein